MKGRNFYQVMIAALAWLLIATNAHGSLISDFDDGTMQGWSEGDPFNLGSFGGALSIINSGGNPGGYLRATDSVGGGGSLAALAPSVLSGDLTLLGGISWDVLLPSQATGSTDILLEGMNGTFYRSDFTLLSTQPVNAWFTKSVSFGSELDWNLLIGTETFLSVVTNVKALYIEMDATVCCAIEAGIDNVRTLNPVPIPAAAWLFGTALIGLVGFSKRRKEA